MSMIPGSNCISFTGCLEWHKFTQKNSTWGVINCRVGLPIFEFRYLGDNFTVNKPIVWINISVSLVDNQMDDRSETFLESLDTEKYLFIREARISNWKPKDAPERYNIEIPMDRVIASLTAFPVVNNCYITGELESMDVNGKSIVSSPYATKSGLSTRRIPIVNSRGYEPENMGSEVAVFGKVCGRKVDGTDELYIMAEAIISKP